MFLSCTEHLYRRKNYFHDLVQYPIQKFFAFPQPRYVLRMFLNFGHFSASYSCKKGCYRKRVYVHFNKCINIVVDVNILDLSALDISLTELL